jgi:hypothetical protein
LREWAPFSLIERAHQVTIRFGIPCTVAMLTAFYKRNQVKYARCGALHFEAPHKVRPNELYRRLFAFQLISLEMRSEPIIFVDETQVHAWTRSGYIWTPPGMRLAQPQQPYRGASLTIIGGIGHCVRGGGFFQLIDSTNSKNFIAFVKELSNRLTLPGYKKPYIVVDGHGAHKTVGATDAMNKSFHPLYLPPITSALSPVEFAWKVIK